MDTNSNTPNPYRRSSRRPILLTLGLIFVIIAALVAAAIGLQHPSQPSSKLQVVAAENFWGNIVAQIGGNHVTVTSIITNPNADPHLYESDPHDAAAVASATLVVENGVGYDDFMDKLLGASPNPNRQVITAAKVVGVSGGDPNPHLWYDIADVKMVAASAATALAAKDPAHRPDYETNLRTFDDSLQPLQQTETAIKDKYAGTTVAYTERVPGYVVEATGLTVATPPGFASAIEDGNDPSPADTTAMDNLMVDHGVKVLLYNAQTTSAVTEQVKGLAKQHDVPVIGVTETLPAGEHSYQSWQLDQLRALQHALGG